MMKSALIFVLILALGSAAFFTRPKEAEFKTFIGEQATHSDTNILMAGWNQLQSDRFVRSCTFNDRLLWVDVEQNGKTVYTGAFNHWFNRAQVSADVKSVEKKIEGIKIDAK